MYSGSGKGARGGGRGGGGRRFPAGFPAPTTKRSSNPGGGGGHGGHGGGVSSSGRVFSNGRHGASTEESFSLVSGKPPVFASLIRLAPDLVEEIKRVEAQGGRARIKFDPNASNPLGNVIEVGGKNFRFTWSHESAGLCDIYDERRSGEDGGGLLVESGCAWRKLNVQRVLDESTKNHVKMRSEEAEKKMKSRKAIVLEHGNPSMKSQMKAMAAVEVNPWKTGFKQRKEASFKKRKVEQNQVGVFSKPHKKSAPSLLPTTKHGSSPPASPHHYGGFTSPVITGGLNKGQALADGVPVKVSPVQENTTNFGKNTTSNTASVVTGSAAGREKTEGKDKVLSASTDLCNMLISLLTENPKGMTLKALAKAVGETIPKSVAKIELVIKKIAIFQAPGKYLLKPGIEVENFKTHSRENGSFPEDHHHHTTVDDNHGVREVAVPPPNMTDEFTSTKEAVIKQVVLEDKPDPQQLDYKFDPSPHISPEKNTGDHNNRGSSNESGSGSESETESSDSGSDSGSHSRSRSSGGSGTGSSSDSDSDPSSNSKQVSEEDVEIMTSDDDKESSPKPPQISTLFGDHSPDLGENPPQDLPHTLVFSNNMETNQNPHFSTPAADSEISGRKPDDNLDKGSKSGQNQYPSQGHRASFEVQDKVACAAGRKTPRNLKAVDPVGIGLVPEFPRIEDTPKKKTSPEICKPNNDKVVRKGAHFVQEEVRVYEEIVPEGPGECQRKVWSETISGLAIHYPKESTSQRINAEEPVVSGTDDSDINWPFSKYEKKAPDMKIEIRDLHQYSDYVYEYQEKYDSYRSVITILEGYRDKFTKLWEELEISKNKDMDRFHAVLKKMNSSFRQSAVRHKRLKKVLLVLHDELKSLKERMTDFAHVYS